MMAGSYSVRRETAKSEAWSTSAANNPFNRYCVSLYFLTSAPVGADHEHDGHPDPVTKLRHDHASHTDVQHEHMNINEGNQYNHDDQS